jgi:hypothetical protein
VINVRVSVGLSGLLTSALPTFKKLSGRWCAFSFRSVQSLLARAYHASRPHSVPVKFVAVVLGILLSGLINKAKVAVHGKSLDLIIHSKNVTV